MNHNTRFSHSLLIVIDPKSKVRTITSGLIKLQDLDINKNNRFLVPFDGGFVKAKYEGRIGGFYTFTAYYKGKMETIKFGRIEKNMYVL